MTRACILVAEDEHILANDLCDTVKEAGFLVEGPYRDSSSAMLSFQKHRPDVAILDVKLNDGKVFALAEKLEQAEIPIIFHSGLLSRDEVESRFPNAMTLRKPCPPAEMLAAVNASLAAV